MNAKDDTQGEWDPISILVLDDNPASLQGKVLVNGRPNFVPHVTTPGWEALFKVQWLATVDEGRKFLDGARRIALRAPRVLGDAGIVPDVLLFDYALTEKNVSVAGRQELGEHRCELASPLPPLAGALQRVRDTESELTSVPPFAVKSKSPPAPSSAVQMAGKKNSKDNCGCFVGGLLLEVFFGHPCAGVPTTAWGEDKTAGTEAGFFEWLLERELGVDFAAKGRPHPQWREVLPYAMPRLRKRIEQLHNANLITLSLEDLLSLSAGHAPDAFPHALRVWTRFGLKRMPINALFLEQSEENKWNAVRDWARGRLQHLFDQACPQQNIAVAQDDITNARSFAQRLLEVYLNSDLPLKRAQLAASKPDAKWTDTAFDIWSIAGGAAHRSIRWAALFVIVRLYALKESAQTALREMKVGDAIDLAEPCKNIAVADVFLALHPVPESYPKQSNFAGSKEGKRLIRLNDQDRSSLPSPKAEDGSGGQRIDAGNLGLDLSDVLDGKYQRVDADTPGNEWTFGLIAGEEYLLRSYAEDYGLRTSDGSAFLNLIFPET